MNIRSILIVDDSEEDHFITEAIIHEFDKSIEIHKAYDGKEALDVLEELEKLEKNPSLVLLDINMPRMGGMEFLERYNKTNGAAVVIMLTSSDQDIDKKKALSFDVVKKYITKPLEVNDLQDIKSL